MRAEFVYLVHPRIPELTTVPALEYHILCQVLSQVLGIKQKTNKPKKQQIIALMEFIFQWERPTIHNINK